MKSVTSKIISLFTLLTMLTAMLGVVPVFAQGTIAGDAVILRAPAGHTVKVSYSLEGTDASPVWSLDGAPAGVEIREDGGLLVKGEAASGTFDVIASDESGNELASKSVTIMDKLYNWADNYERAYVNFEEQTEGSAPSDRVIGTSNWNDHVIRFKRANRTNDPLALVKQEANGNKYVSAIGTSSWYNNGASFLTDIISVSDDTKNAFINADVTTVEADFMAESAMISSYNSGSTFWSLMTVVPNGSSSVALDLRYKPSGTEFIEIHSFTDSNGAGNQTSSQGRIATLPVDTWFNVRIEADITGATYDLYINNEKIYTGKHTMPSLACSNYIGIGVDNFAAYTGRLQVPHISDVYADTLWFTPSRTEAVADFDTSVYLGSYPYENKVSYTSGDATVVDGKVFVPAGTSDVLLSASDTMFNLAKTITISREQGTELNFDGSDAGMISGTAVLSDGTLDTGVGTAVFDLKNAHGNMLLTLDTFGALSLALETSLGALPLGISVPAPDAEFGEVLLAANTITEKYTVLLDGELISQGNLPAGELESISVSGAAIDNFVYSSMNVTKPYALGSAIVGVTSVGQELEAGYNFYSPWGGSQIASNVKWLASDTRDGTYHQVATGEFYTPGESLADKWLMFSITVSDEKGTSDLYESEPYFINDTYSLAKSDAALTLTALDSLGGSNAYGVICLYSGNVLRETRFRKIEFTGSEYIWNVDMTGFDGASAVLLYENDLRPVSTPKTVGTVPSYAATHGQSDSGIYVKDGVLYISGTAGTTASVLIYSHNQSASDATVAYSVPYDRDDVLPTAGSASAKDYLSYATAVVLNSQGKAAMSLPALEDGSYTADIIFKNGTDEQCTFMVSPQNIMTASNMNNPGFADVLKLYSLKSDEAVDRIYSYYTLLSHDARNKVAALLAGSGYDISMFDAAVLLCSYFEKEVFDQNLYSQLKAELASKSLDAIAIDIMKYDAAPNATGSVILADTWHGFDELLSIAADKAVLYGVYHVKNYMEADNFLSYLTDTNYPSSGYKDGICLTVAGKLYNSIAELKQDVNSYVPSVGTSGGSSGGSFGGSAGSSQITVPVPSAPQKTQQYTDVSPDHWAEESISYLSAVNIINGNPDGTFAPEAQITRAEFVKIICAAFDISGNDDISFKDVDNASWYAAYVKKAASAGIVNGADGNFMPDNPITRQDASVIIHRVLSSHDDVSPVSEAGFGDVNQISDYAREAVGTLWSMGLINGMDDGNFYPQNLMTRAQCAHIIANVLRSFAYENIN